MNLKDLDARIAELASYIKASPPSASTHVRPVHKALVEARKLALAAQDAYTTGLLPSGCDLHRIARRIK